MTMYYEGKIVPERIDEKGRLECDNVYCATIHCTDCILFEEVYLKAMERTELMMRAENEYIQRSIEGLPDGDGYETGEGLD